MVDIISYTDRALKMTEDEIDLVRFSKLFYSQTKILFAMSIIDIFQIKDNLLLPFYATVQDG